MSTSPRRGRSKIKSSIRSAVSDPDYCKVAVSGKLGYDDGKKVVAKIFNR